MAVGLQADIAARVQQAIWDVQCGMARIDCNERLRISLSCCCPAKIIPQVPACACAPLPPMTVADADHINCAHELQRNGFAVLPQFLDPSQLEQLRLEADTLYELAEAQAQAGSPSAAAGWGREHIARCVHEVIPGHQLTPELRTCYSAHRSHRSSWPLRGEVWHILFCSQLTRLVLALLGPEAVLFNDQVRRLRERQPSRCVITLHSAEQLTSPCAAAHLEAALHQPILIPLAPRLRLVPLWSVHLPAIHLRQGLGLGCAALTCAHCAILWYS